MFRFPIGLSLLAIVSVLIFLGLGHRILDRMRLSDRGALLFLGAMFVGGLLPDVPLARGLSINIGGAVIPLGLAVYLFAKADSAVEKTRAAAAAVVTGGLVFFLSRTLPTDRATILDPLYVFPLAAGIVAYLLGRSRRSAFIGGVVGVILADLAEAVGAMIGGTGMPVAIGGAGIFDAVVLTGFIAVGLAEIVGETAEKLTTGGKPHGGGGKGGTPESETRRDQRALRADEKGRVSGERLEAGERRNGAEERNRRQGGRRDD